MEKITRKRCRARAEEKHHRRLSLLIEAPWLTWENYYVGYKHINTIKWNICLRKVRWAIAPSVWNVHAFPSGHVLCCAEKGACFRATGVPAFTHYTVPRRAWHTVYSVHVQPSSIFSGRLVLPLLFASFNIHFSTFRLLFARFSSRSLLSCFISGSFVTSLAFPCDSLSFCRVAIRNVSFCFCFGVFVVYIIKKSIIVFIHFTPSWLLSLCMLSVFSAFVHFSPCFDSCTSCCCCTQKLFCVWNRRFETIDFSLRIFPAYESAFAITVKSVL